MPLPRDTWLETKECSILIGGSGGQGVLFFGRLLAYSCMTEDREVTWFPSYGAEMRGGTANCTVIISSEMIGSPIVRNPDILISLNSPSYDRFQCALKTGGTLLYDASLFTPQTTRENIVSYGVSALAMATSCSAPNLANVVMLGALLALRRISRIDSVMRSLGPLLGERNRELLRVNELAIRKGYEAYNGTEGPHY